MAKIRIPNILTDLAHVGNAGLLPGGNPAIKHELEICRQWGYRIQQEGERAVLPYDEDQIVPYWLQREVPDLAWGGLRVNGYLQIDSTNTEALEQARAGAPEGTLIYAEEQTAGKGRGDRDWYSPPGSSLYFSLIVRPKQEEKYWPLLTHVASVALVEAILDLKDAHLIPRDLDMDIKWPNDVLVSGKKCAGILLQTLNDSGNRAVVAGIGIDVHPGSVPEELKAEAVSIDEAAKATLPRRKILVGFLKHFQKSYMAFENGDFGDVLESWKSISSMWNGTKIWIEEGGRRRQATTRGLSEIGALIVETEEGKQETVLTGTVRFQKPE